MAVRIPGGEQATQLGRPVGLELPLVEVRAVGDDRAKRLIEDCVRPPAMEQAGAGEPNQEVA